MGQINIVEMCIESYFDGMQTIYKALENQFMRLHNNEIEGVNDDQKGGFASACIIVEELLHGDKKEIVKQLENDFKMKMAEKAKLNAPKEKKKSKPKVVRNRKGKVKVRT